MHNGLLKFNLIIIALTFSINSYSAILVEDQGKAVNRSYSKVSDDSFQFKNQRKVGIGWGAAGALGLMGLQLELNFTPDYAFSGGFGISRGFQSAAFAFKRSFSGTSFSPYINAGFARWYTTSKNGALDETSPGFLADKFLSGKERRSGQFAENMIYPGAGIQYMQLDGAWAGASFYAEALILVDIDDLVVAPTGGIGMYYYF